MTNDSKTEPLAAAQQAVAGIELGAGSEHYRHGRETMKDDAIKAVGNLRELPWAVDALRMQMISNLETFLDLPPEDREWIAYERPILMKRLRAAVQKSLESARDR